MGSVLRFYDGYTSADFCGLSGASEGVRETVQLALDLDDEGLVDCDAKQLDEAQNALLYCRDTGCAFHADQRLALDALGAAIVAEMQRAADLDEEEADAMGPDCCRSASGCAGCVGDAR